MTTLRLPEPPLAPDDAPLQFAIRKPAGVLPAFFAATITAFLYIIVVWPLSFTLVNSLVLGILSIPSGLLLWASIRRWTIEIDASRAAISSRLDLLGVTVRRKLLGRQIDRVVVAGDPELFDTGAVLRTLRATDDTGHMGFTVCLEGPGRALKLATFAAREPAEERAREIAGAAGIPAIRRGYYLGKPREGAINRIRSEEAWTLALTRGVVLTGDPDDTSAL